MEKLNIAELLKDCPKGMELNCTMYENVEFDYVEQNSELTYPIHCLIKINGGYNALVFTRNGCNDRHPNAKCVIFPKGKTTWEGFQRPFKDGDIIYVCDEYSDAKFTYVAILKQIEEGEKIKSHCFYNFEDDYFSTHDFLYDGYNTRFATEKEKETLFKTIKDNGYKWNPETKTLEKLIEPKFKVGDRIKHKEKTKWVCTIARVKDIYYVDGHPMCFTLPFGKQDDYELVPNKFDINTFKPFDKVLVRDSDKCIWCASFFSHIWKDKYFCVGAWYNQCIPYGNNGHLLGTTNDCDEFYKTW